MAGPKDKESANAKNGNGKVFPEPKLTTISAAVGMRFDALLAADRHDEAWALLISAMVVDDDGEPMYEFDDVLNMPDGVPQNYFVPPCVKKLRADRDAALKNWLAVDEEPRFVSQPNSELATSTAGLIE